ncbi:tetratricopeptide repeat protein [candidate division KSB1 bacterium]|nr:tetratricopeptide repeat protein [candidate division KSB1 bacterium]
MASCLLAGFARSQESPFVAAALLDVNGDMEKLDKLIEQHENLIRKYPNDEFAPTILFQLAELYQQKSSIEFQTAMEEFEAKSMQHENGEISYQPIIPRISLSETIRCCLRLLKDFPDIEYKDKVLYKLAMAYFQEANYTRAKFYFEQIIESFPQSSINLESHFRIGEYYFDKRDYQNAILHYKALLKKWNNPYFDMALYKMGWSYYNLNDFSKAISTFIYLIDDISLLERTESQILLKNTTDLRLEAITYIASSFTEFGGPGNAREFLMPIKEKEYTLKILQKMSDLYERRNYYTEAIETNQLILEIYPFYQYAPEIYLKIIENYEKDDQIDAANRERAKFVELYGPGSIWLSHFSTGDLYKKGVEMTRSTMKYLGTYYQAEGQRTNRVRDYHLAIEKYQEYLEKFPHVDDSDRINYLLAECFYNIRQYEEAAAAYHDVVTRYDSSAYRQDAAYNRILCYYQMTGIDQPMDSVTIYLDDFMGSGEILTVRVAHQTQINLLQACNDFVIMFPDNKWYDQVLMKYGEALHEMKAYIAAIKVYDKVMALNTGNKFRALAAMNIGQCYFDAGYYKESEEWYDKFTTLFSDSVQYLAKAKKMAISSRFKLAEQFSQNGESGQAATLLTSILERTNDPEFQERAMFEAAIQYQKSDNTQQAALILEDLVKRYPASDLAEDALYKAATLREQNGEMAAAAYNYLKVADVYPLSKYAKRALKSAAICYESIDDWHSAGQVYEKFTTKYADARDDFIEAMYKCGDMALKQSRNNDALEYFRNTVYSYKQMQNNGLTIDSYYAANAQFMIGEILFQDYKKIELVDESTFNRKQDYFRQVIASFTNTLEFRVADWSTAASLRIGMTFEEFGRALSNSPPPQNLEEEELKLYTEALAKRVRPFKERALETYRKNIQQAESNQIDNQWVAESRERLKALTIELRIAGNG